MDAIEITPETLSKIFNQDIVEVEINGGRVYWYTRHGGIARSNINRKKLDAKYKEWKKEK